LENIRERRGEQKQSFGELQRQGLGFSLPQTPNRLVHFEAVVRGKRGERGVQVGVVENRIRDL
jgi:hypothetical protein